MREGLLLPPAEVCRNTVTHYLAFINFSNFFPFGKAQRPLGEVADQICDTV